MRFRAAVLAGGGSRRMGRDKAFVELDGLPLVRRIADSLVEAGAESVVVVGGDRERLASVGLTCIDDPEPGGGPGQAIASALRQMSTSDADLVMVMACDLVDPTPGAIQASVRALAGAPGAALAVPLLDGRPQWLHACWRTRLAVDPLTMALARGARSVRACVAGLVVVEVEGIDPGALADADEPADLPDRADRPSDGA